MPRPRPRGTAVAILIAALLTLGSAALLLALALGGWREATAPDRAGLSENQVQTLRSLALVDDHPLYTMRYYGSYRQEMDQTAAGEPNLSPGHGRESSELWGSARRDAWSAALSEAKGCSLFAALGDPSELRFGRNFDWHFSPAVLLFTDPPDAYASVSMVDIAYLGFEGEQAGGAALLPVVDRQALLDTPWLPFDGMNEHGLTVGMAAVPDRNVPPDADKPSVGSLRVIREMLDRARTVDEAVAVMDQYNVDMGGGPALHYLIADRTGRAALVEYTTGERTVLYSGGNWQAATNFLRAESGVTGLGRCARYDRIVQRLQEAQGSLDARQAMDLLAEVSQPNTQWSVVYDLGTGRVRVSMGRDYGQVYSYGLAEGP